MKNVVIISGFFSPGSFQFHGGFCKNFPGCFCSKVPHLLLLEFCTHDNINWKKCKACSAKQYVNCFINVALPYPASHILITTYLNNVKAVESFILKGQAV